MQRSQGHNLGLGAIAFIPYSLLTTSTNVLSKKLNGFLAAVPVFEGQKPGTQQLIYCGERPKTGRSNHKLREEKKSTWLCSVHGTITGTSPRLQLDMSIREERYDLRISERVTGISDNG